MTHKVAEAFENMQKTAAKVVRQSVAEAASSFEECEINKEAVQLLSNKGLVPLHVKTILEECKYFRVLHSTVLIEMKPLTSITIRSRYPTLRANSALYM